MKRQYVTDDGVIHLSLADAKKHEAKLKLKDPTPPLKPPKAPKPPKIELPAIEPIYEPFEKAGIKIGVIDTETDPFKFGRIPKPFAAEFYSEDHYFQTWGATCIPDIIDFIINKVQEPHLIFAHNGGKFDFHMMLGFIDNPIKIIKSRIVQARLEQHTLRDSYAIIPIALGTTGEKTQIDYSKFEAHCREKHKKEILNYLHDDCLALYKYVAAFVDRFGAKLTVGSTAINEISQRHEFERMNKKNDEYFRRFYFGGRVECYQSGILKNGPYKAFDVNSMYPKVMRDFRHPVNGQFTFGKEMPDDFELPFFLHFKGSNKKALPIRTKDGLSFEQEYGDFFACSHELEIALKYDLVTIDEIYECAVATEFIQFDKFVDEFYEQKSACKKAGDKIGETFAKFMLNSGYGKFGQNPENFSDWLINRDYGADLELMAKGYVMAAEFDEFELWEKPANILDSAYYDVSIAASITSGARAILLEGLQLADTPIYCDTDSIICKGFNGNISDFELGAWKLETTANNCAIAGKKLYMLYDADKPFKRKNDKKWENPYKLSSKGGTLTPQDMIKICRGNVVHFENIAPTFSLGKNPSFITRDFKSTIEGEPELE